jgi:hypothetical protein
MAQLQQTDVYYVSSIAVVMITMVTVISSMAIVPGAVTVRIRLRITVIRSHVVPIGVIIVGRRISIIAARKSEADSSNSGKSARDLSAGPRSGSESQSTYRQSNQEKLFHKISPFLFLFCEGRNLSQRFPRALRPALHHKIGYERSCGSRIREIPAGAPLPLGRGNPPQNRNDKPKEHYGCGVQRNIENNAYGGDSVTKEIVFMTVSHNDNDPGRP